MTAEMMLGQHDAHGRVEVESDGSFMIREIHHQKSGGPIYTHWTNTDW